MIAVIQRIDRAAVTVEGAVTGDARRGLLVLLGVAREDTRLDAELLAAKIAKLRIFTDENDKMNLSVLDVGGDVLVVSNFTLLANYSHGNRPEYFGAAAPDAANELYEYFAGLMETQLGGSGGKVGRGVFGAHMLIDIQANGPVTIVMDSEKLKKKGKE